MANSQQKRLRPRSHKCLSEDACCCRVVFVSGYSGSLGPKLPSGTPFLEKPFGQGELVDAVREALEGVAGTEG